MALRLSPAHPLVWRTPDEVQFGVEQPVLRVSPVGPDREFVLGLLAKGVSRPVLGALAALRGLPPPAVERMLAELSPALEVPGPAPALLGLTVAVSGHGEVVAPLEQLLRRSGATLVVPGSPCDAGVLVSHFATAPRRGIDWLRDDVPHLLVEFGDRSVRVGPVVVAGRSPCATCLELHRVDADPCWPALAAQLSTRVAPTADPAGGAMAAGVAVTALIQHRTAVLLGEPSRWERSALRIRPADLLGWEPDAAPAPAVEPGAAFNDAAGRAGTAAERAETPSEGAGTVTEIAPTKTERAEAVTTRPGIVTERVSPHPRCGCRSLPENARAPDRLPGGCPTPPTTVRDVRERG